MNSDNQTSNSPADNKKFQENQEAKNPISCLIEDHDDVNQPCLDNLNRDAPHDPADQNNSIEVDKEEASDSTKTHSKGEAEQIDGVDVIKIFDSSNMGKKIGFAI